jgi:glycosyltransferase involved in cell wall biosynthesis
MSVSSISIIIPFVDSWDITSKSIEYLAQNTSTKSELVLIDNGSDNNYREDCLDIIRQSNLDLIYIKNDINICALPTFKQGFDAASGDILCYMHNDVLIHEEGWDQRVLDCFNQDTKMGLVGLFGARKVHQNGGRDGCTSNMLGKVWGSCSCHPVASMHHGEIMVGISPSVVFDSLSMFFSRDAMRNLIENTDSFADWRSPSHFYDRFFGIKVLDLGYHMATIGIGFDHYGGGTSGASPKYKEFLRSWLTEHNVPYSDDDDLDIKIYQVAESQWLTEFAHRLPVSVDSEYNLTWGW